MIQEAPLAQAGRSKLKRSRSLYAAATAAIAICALIQAMIAQQRSARSSAQVLEPVGLQWMMTQQLILQALAATPKRAAANSVTPLEMVLQDTGAKAVQAKVTDFELKAGRIAQLAKQLEAVESFHHLHSGGAQKMELLSTRVSPKGSAAGEDNAHKLMHEVREFEKIQVQQQQASVNGKSMLHQAKGRRTKAIRATHAVRSARVEALLHTADKYKSLAAKMQSASAQISALTAKYQKAVTSMQNKTATDKKQPKARTLTSLTQSLHQQIHRQVDLLRGLLQQAAALPKSVRRPKPVTKPAASRPSLPEHTDLLTPSDAASLRAAAAADRKKALKGLDKLAKKPKAKLKGWRLEYAKLMARPSQEDHEMAKEIKARHVVSDHIHARLEKERARMAKLLHGLES
jgi:hypothetical protein